MSVHLARLEVVDPTGDVVLHVVPAGVTLDVAPGAVYVAVLVSHPRLSPASTTVPTTTPPRKEPPMPNRTAYPLLAALAVVYVAGIALANHLTSTYGLVGVGFGLVTTAGTFAAGGVLLVRDFLHRAALAVFGERHALVFVAACILAAGVVSLATSTPALAFASTAAFLAAELVDLLVFTPLRARRGFVAAAGASNVVSAPVDTFAFLLLAGFPITGAAVAGQLVGKLVWATAVPLCLYVIAAATTRRGAAATA